MSVPLSSPSTDLHSVCRTMCRRGAERREGKLAVNFFFLFFFSRPPFLFSYGEMETCPIQTLQGKQQQWKDIGSFWRLHTGLRGSRAGAGEGAGSQAGGSRAQVGGGGQCRHPAELLGDSRASEILRVWRQLSPPHCPHTFPPLT